MFGKWTCPKCERGFESIRRYRNHPCPAALIYGHTAIDWARRRYVRETERRERETGRRERVNYV